jgi:hypothetical protein
MNTSLTIKAAAHRCWFVASTELAGTLFKGGINETGVEGIVTSMPELQEILPQDAAQRHEVSVAVFQHLQERKRGLDGIPDFLLSTMPPCEDATLEASYLRQHLDTMRVQIAESLSPLEDYILGEKSFRELFIRDSGSSLSAETSLPFEGFMNKTLEICRTSGDKEEKLQFVERFRQILAEELPEDKEGILNRFKEIIFHMNNMGGIVLSKNDRIELLKIIDEELSRDPGLRDLYEKSDGNIDHVINVAYTSLAASNFMNTNFGQDTRPEDFRGSTS